MARGGPGQGRFDLGKKKAPQPFRAVGFVTACYILTSKELHLSNSSGVREE